MIILIVLLFAIVIVSIYFLSKNAGMEKAKQDNLNIVIDSLKKAEDVKQKIANESDAEIADNLKKNYTDE